jgi:hypothetical protein
MGFLGRLFGKPDRKPQVEGISFQQEAYDTLARMEAFVPYEGQLTVGMRVRIGSPMAGTAKPDETGLPSEVILDPGLTGTIIATTSDEQPRIRWDPGTCRIYGDLDLSTMQFVARGSLKHEGFECSLHKGYLQVLESTPAPSEPPGPVHAEPVDADSAFYQYDMRSVDVLRKAAVCSDRACPCPETPIPDGTGYLYISDAAVERMTALKEGRGGDTFGAGLMPVLVCEQGARLRGLDLRVAAEDASRWWECGRVPLRPSPMAPADDDETPAADTAAEFRERAAGHVERKEYDQAIACCTEWIRAFPNDRAAYLIRGGALVLNGEGVRGLADMEKAKSMDG